MTKKLFKRLILEDYGVINKSNRTAVEIYERLVVKHQLQFSNVEIINDSIVRFHLFDYDDNITHFRIKIEDKNNIEYSIEYIEGKNSIIKYFVSKSNTIEYLDEFFRLCLYDDIYTEFNLEYPEFKTKFEF